MSYHPLNRFSTDPANWKFGIFYFCRADPRIIVPRRIRGFGWTINLARPLALPLTAFLMAAVWSVLELSRSFGGGGDARFAIKVLAALSVIALCYRLSNPEAKKPDSD